MLGFTITVMLSLAIILLFAHAIVFGDDRTLRMIRSALFRAFLFVMRVLFSPVTAVSWCIQKVNPKARYLAHLREEVTNLRLRLGEIQRRCGREISGLHSRASMNAEGDVEESNVPYQRLGVLGHMSSLDHIAHMIKEGKSTAGQREQFIRILQDLNALLDLTPAVGVKYVRDGHGGKRKEAKWDSMVAFPDEALQVFLERVGEVKVAAEDLLEEIRDAHAAKRGAEENLLSYSLKGVELKSISKGNLTAPALERMGEEENTPLLIEGGNPKPATEVLGNPGAANELRALELFTEERGRIH